MTFETLINAMSPEQRVAAMQVLWEKLAESPDGTEPPAWHGELLAERIARLETGGATLVDWEDARRRLQEKFQ